jgi:hypothetical protein
MQSAHTKRWRLQVTLACLAVAGFLWGIYEHFDDRRSVLLVGQSVSSTATGFRTNIFEDHEKYTAKYLTIEITNTGRSTGRDVHLRVEARPGSWIGALEGYPEWRIEEENGTTHELGSSFRQLSGERSLLKARLDKLSPGLQLRTVVAYAFRTDQPVEPPEVLVYDDDGVGH